MEKTNAMRLLDSKKIKYEVHTYPHEEGVCVDGMTVAELLNQNSHQVFKTLVCTGAGQHYVCVVPVAEELDLKKAAKAFGVKSLELVAVKDLFPLTGYVRGGCSPIGMKKSFLTVVDCTAQQYDTIIFSGGKIGFQLEMKPGDLAKVIRVIFKDILREA